MSGLGPLFETVREECSKQIWSHGVLLVREDGVTADSESHQEIQLRVFDSGAGVGFKVSLWPQDEDWRCDCRDGDPCKHVAAAVIALKRSYDSGKPLPQSDSHGGRIVYSFTVEGEALAFERLVESEAGERRPLTLSLLDPQLSITPTQNDILYDDVLRQHRGGVIERPLLKRWCSKLAEDLEVEFNKQVTLLLRKPRRPLLVVSDKGPNIHLGAQPDPEVKKLFSNDICQTKTGLAFYQRPDLSPQDLTMVRQGKLFFRQDFAALATEILPRLQRSGEVVLRSRQLPQMERLPLRVELITENLGGDLAITPQLVYGDPVQARVEGGKLISVGDVVPWRKHDQERALAKRMRDLFDHDVGERRVFSREQAMELVTAIDAGSSDIYLAGSKASKDFKLYSQLQLQLEYQEGSGGGLSASFFQPSVEEGSEGDRHQQYQVDIGALERALQEDRPVVPLLDGGFAPLPKDWRQRHGAQLLELLAALEHEREPSLVVKAELANFMHDVGAGVAPDLEQAAHDLENINALKFQLPGDLKAELREYQLDGVQRLGRLQQLRLGAILGDDMGLGKTLQTICLMGGRVLVVAPTSVMGNWQNEIQRFRPHLEVSIYHGTNRALPRSHEHVVVTSYALLRLDREQLGKVAWDMVVLDEAHTIKNPQSQVAQAAYSLQADFRLALTGTPVENQLQDIFSQMHFLHPGLLGSAKFFQQAYTRPIMNGDSSAQQRLRRRILPFLLRRTKEEVLKDLPPKSECDLLIDLSEEERRQYETLLLGMRQDVLENLGQAGGVMKALEALLRLRQAACHPKLLPHKPDIASSKLQVLVDKLHELNQENRKALVFSQWTGFLDLMGEALSEQGLEYLRIDGSVPATKRSELVERFQQDATPRVMLISLKAGGVGLNLTAADHVFITDPWWNPAIENQAADRAHRLGQKQAVMIYRLVSRNTIEERIRALKGEKQALADSVLDGGDQPSAQMLRHLFQEILA